VFGQGGEERAEMRRLLRSAAILASVVGLLAGCGDDDDDSGTRDTLDTSEQTASPLDTTTIPATVATTAATSVAATTAATVAAGGQTYTVASGDALSTIAARFQTSVKAIQDANGIEDPNTIFVGQKLQIPPPTAAPTTTATTVAGAGPATTAAAVTPPAAPAVTATTQPGTPGD
jgi:LysM repeat protein